jgi:hypothetical protein
MSVQTAYLNTILDRVIEFVENVDSHIYSDPVLKNKLSNAITDQELDYVADLVNDIDDDYYANNHQNTLAGINMAFEMHDIVLEWQRRVLDDDTIESFMPQKIKGPGLAMQFKAWGHQNLAQIAYKPLRPAPSLPTPNVNKARTRGINLG